MLRAILDFFSSLRLTVACLGAAMVVVVAFVVVVLEELLEPHAAAPREITDKIPAIRMVRLLG